MGRNGSAGSAQWPKWPSWPTPSGLTRHARGWSPRLVRRRWRDRRGLTGGPSAADTMARAWGCHRGGTGQWVGQHGSPRGSGIHEVVGSVTGGGVPTVTWSLVRLGSPWLLHWWGGRKRGWVTPKVFREKWWGWALTGMGVGDGFSVDSADVAVASAIGGWTKGVDGPEEA
jgi:hypothetical protein